MCLKNDKIYEMRNGRLIGQIKLKPETLKNVMNQFLSMRQEVMRKKQRVEVLLEQIIKLEFTKAISGTKESPKVLIEYKSEVEDLIEDIGKETFSIEIDREVTIESDSKNSAGVSSEVFGKAHASYQPPPFLAMVPLQAVPKAPVMASSTQLASSTSASSEVGKFLCLHPVFSL